MLSKKDRKNLEIKFNNIYLNSKISNKLYTEEIINLINKFNKKNKVRNNLKISEKTSLVISYGNSVTDGNRKSLKVFYGFFKKYLKKSFDTIHFVPFFYTPIINKAHIFSEHIIMTPWSMLSPYKV